MRLSTARPLSLPAAEACAGGAARSSRIFGEATGERAFRICAFLLHGFAAHRFAFGWDAGELQSEQAAQQPRLFMAGSPMTQRDAMSAGRSGGLL